MQAPTGRSRGPGGRRLGELSSAAMMLPPARSRFPLPVAARRAVRVVHADEIRGIDDFYERFAHEPLVVRGIWPPGHPARELSLADVQAGLGTRPLDVWDTRRQDYLAVPLGAFFEAFARGSPADGTGWNIVDHHIVDTPLAPFAEPPPFLRRNWFVGPPVGWDGMERSVVLTPAGRFSPLHLDSYGMQGWMALAAGRKTWELLSPADTPGAWLPAEKRFFDGRTDDPARVPALASATAYTATLAAGELLFFPGGWAHQVDTDEASHGFGGSLLNEHQVEAHVRGWLWEREQGVAGDLDLRAALERMPAERVHTPGGRANLTAALRACAEWEARAGGAG